jgi:ElaB/YqjD/DUF883 family membrane-anchored ribosome-binding protein
MTISDYTRRPSAAPRGQAQRGDGRGQFAQEPGEVAARPLAGATPTSAETAREPGANLRRGLERARILAAEALSRAAANLRAPSTGVDTPARRFADSLERSATYLRQTNLAGMQRDTVELVRRHPLQALGIAFAFGLFVGQRLGRD